MNEPASKTGPTAATQEAELIGPADPLVLFREWLDQAKRS